MKVRLNQLKNVALALLLASSIPALAQSSAADVPWTGTWAVTPWTTGDAGFNNQTIRQIVYTSIGGSAARVRLSNLFGSEPLQIGNVHIALRDRDARIIPGSDRLATFGGQTAITIPRGAEVLSDAVVLDVPALGNVAVSIYLPGRTANNSTGHAGSLQDVYIAPGDVGGSVDLPGGSANSVSGQAYYFLTGLDVQNPAATGAVVAFGASITDGIASRGNVNRRWPNDLARRLQQANMTVGVLNQGISGNNFFYDGAGQAGRTRFNRDALQQAGVKWVIVSDDAVNSLNNGNPPPAADFIAVYKELIAQAHQANVKFLCSTLTPFHGTPQWTPAAENVRAQLEAFMKSPDSGCDGIVDQALATSDPADRTRYLPAFNAGDSLHPNEEGLQAIADAVPLNKLRLLPAVTKPQACGQLLAGEGLLPGETLNSCDGRFTLTLGQDGNLTIADGDTQLWASGTAGSSAAEVVLQDDGRLVQYDVKGNVLWQSDSSSHPGAVTFLQNDGNLVIYSNNQPVWASNTCCH